jgi:hypothetical protein
LGTGAAVVAALLGPVLAVRVMVWSFARRSPRPGALM